MATDAEGRLRRALTEVRLATAYQAAVDKGVAAAGASWPDTQPSNQLSVARKVALQEFAALVGWDIK